MNAIKNMFTNGLAEEYMDIDLDFTDRYLSQFESIDKQTIKILIENGYQTREQLMAFDIKEDLPMLPDLNMAQKSLLRKALKQFHENEELETKIYDLKGDDNQSHSLSTVEMTTSANKRKRESVAPIVPSMSTKRLRSSPVNNDIPNDGLGDKMRQLVHKRRSIRVPSYSGYQISNSQTDSDNEPDLMPSHEQKNFSLNNKNQTGFGLNQTITYSSFEEDVDEEEEEELQMAELKKRRGRPSRSTSTLKGQTTRITGARDKLYPHLPETEDFEGEKEAIKPKPLRRMTGIQSQVLRPDSSPPRRLLNRTARKSIATNWESTANMITKTKTTPKSTRSSSSPSTHIPTPTELEVRERLAQKKALAQNKSGRKRR